MYDIIGDVHGQAALLKKLLKELGYEKKKQLYTHPERKAVFVGDFLNRGPEIRKTLRIVREMNEEGKAIVVLGNHELNALLFNLKNKKKQPLLPPLGKRYASVVKTAREFESFPAEWKEHRQWLRTLPFFFEDENIRVVHACWKDENIAFIKNHLSGGKIPKKVLREIVLKPKSELSTSILQTVRGIFHLLPGDLRIFDNHRRSHRFYRIRWWTDPAGLTFRQLSFESKFRLPDYTIPAEILPPTASYPMDAPPLFFGHYCRGKGPHIISNNLCCVDACVTGRHTLAAYRWDGEKDLDTSNLLIIK